MVEVDRRLRGLKEGDFGSGAVINIGRGSTRGKAATRCSTISRELELRLICSQGVTGSRGFGFTTHRQVDAALGQAPGWRINAAPSTPADVIEAAAVDSGTKSACASKTRAAMATRRCSSAFRQALGPFFEVTR